MNSHHPAYIADSERSRIAPCRRDLGRQRRGNPQEPAATREAWFLTSGLRRLAPGSAVPDMPCFPSTSAQRCQLSFTEYGPRKRSRLLVGEVSHRRNGDDPKPDPGTCAPGNSPMAWLQNIRALEPAPSTEPVLTRRGPQSSSVSAQIYKSKRKQVSPMRAAPHQTGPSPFNVNPPPASSSRGPGRHKGACGRAPKLRPREGHPLRFRERNVTFETSGRTANQRLEQASALVLSLNAAQGSRS